MDEPDAFNALRCRTALHNVIRSGRGGSSDDDDIIDASFPQMGFGQGDLFLGLCRLVQ